MTNLYHKTLKNSVLLGASLVLTMSLGLLLKMFIPRKLGTEAAGVFYFAESFSSAFFCFVPFGMKNYIDRVIPGDHTATKDIIVPIFMIECFFSIVIFIAMYLCLLVIQNNNHTIRLTCLIGLSSLSLVLSDSILKPIFFALNRPALVSTLNVVFKGIQTISVVSIGMIFHDPIFIALAFGLSGMIPVLIYSYLLMRENSVEAHIDFDKIKEIVIFSIPFFAVGVLVDIYPAVDRTLLSKFGNNTEVGLHGVAFTLRGAFLMLVPILISLAKPVMSSTLKNDPVFYRSFIANTMRFLLVSTFPLAVILMTFSFEFVPLLFGKQFILAGPVAFYTAPTIMLCYLNVLLTAHISLVTNGRLLGFIILGTIGVNAICCFLFIPSGIAQFGIGGGAITVALITMINEILSSITFLYLCREYVLNGKNVRIMLMAFFAILFLWLMRGNIQSATVYKKLYLLVLGVPAYMIFTQMVTLQEVKNSLDHLKRYLLKVAIKP